MVLHLPILPSFQRKANKGTIHCNVLLREAAKPGGVYGGWAIVKSKWVSESKRIATSLMLLTPSLCKFSKHIYFITDIFDIWKLKYQICMNAQHDWETRFSPLKLMIRKKKMFFLQDSVLVYTIFLNVSNWTVCTLHSFGRDKWNAKHWSLFNIWRKLKWKSRKKCYNKVSLK